MQHNYYVRRNEPEHQPRRDHTHEVRHRNGYGATVTTRHYGEGDALVEKRWRENDMARRYPTAHGYRVEVVPVTGGTN